MPKFDRSKFRLQQFYDILQCDNRNYSEPDSKDRDTPTRRHLKFTATNKYPLATKKPGLNDKWQMSLLSANSENQVSEANNIFEAFKSSVSNSSVNQL